MKALLSILLIILSFSFSTPHNSEINKEVTINGRSYLYGEINREGLTNGIYKNWFNAYYNSYRPDTQSLAACTEESLEGLTVKILMATWCGDSKRNVPVFYKIMDSVGFSENKLQVYALDYRKQGPNNEQVKYRVSRVPTIIFYRDDVEVGRFVERLRPGQRMEDVVLDLINK